MRKGLSVDETVRTIIDELRVALADDPGRDWPDLEWRVRDKCLRLIRNNPELAAAYRTICAPRSRATGRRA